MSSTYSPDLRIELIATGEQAGVWGFTTNNNLGTLLETAIAGYTSVNIASSAQALTALNGAVDQSRYASIALTTSTSAAFSVFIPPSPKLYVFYNTSSYAAAVYNSTVIGNTTPAGTGMLIPAGKTMAVWSDGTNVTQQTNYLYAPTLSNATLLGSTSAPTQAYGDSTGSIATTAFVQAALQALYPVGVIYTSTVSTNPNSIFGFGTWVAYGQGRVLVSQDGGSFPAGATGGSTSVTLSTANLPSHTHNFSGTTSATDLSGAFPTSANTGSFYGGTFTRGTQYSGNGGEPQTNSQVNFSGNHTHTYSGTTDGGPGADTAFSVLQPYIVVYMWNRTA